MSFKWYTYEKCNECGHEKESRIRLIDALEYYTARHFGEDVALPIEELQSDIKRVRKQAEQFAKLRSEDAARRNLRIALDQIEKQAAKILSIRETP